jgi:predicted RNA-binding Zn-ribbon protein involved in translation (DUF1610 family)
MNAERITVYLYQWEIDWLKKQDLPMSHFIENLVRKAIEDEAEQTAIDLAIHAVEKAAEQKCDSCGTTEKVKLRNRRSGLVLLCDECEAGKTRAEAGSH